jgi:hypothetical protein
VVLESILASRSDLVATNPEKPLWSPFYLVLREFHMAHTRLEKAIGELAESCGFTFNCIPPEVAKNARDHRFNEDKRYLWLNAVKDTENLLKECTQLAKRNNKKSTSLRKLHAQQAQVQGCSTTSAATRRRRRRRFKP